MSKSRRKSQSARRFEKAKPHSDSSQRSSLTINPDNLNDLASKDRAGQTAQGWHDWLKRQPNPQQKYPDEQAERAGSSDVTTVSTVKPHEWAATDANPVHADVENDIIETGKEKAMQTAKQDNTVIDTSATAKVDLRDTSSAKVSSLKDTAKVVSDDIGSLFGPAIEDDVKGVRSQIRELIQCEMQGELGQRFSRNLRIVIRREIAAAIDDQFDRV